MNKNMGVADRIIRTLIMIILVTLYVTGTVGGTWGVVILIVSGVFLLTGLIGLCPLYAVLGINTCPRRERSSGSANS